MDHGVDARAGFSERRSVANVGLNEFQARRRFEFAAVVHGVIDRNLVVGSEQLRKHQRTHIARSAGDQNIFHAEKLLMAPRTVLRGDRTVLVWNSVSRRCCILVEHLHSFERVLAMILAE